MLLVADLARAECVVSFNTARENSIKLENTRSLLQAAAVHVLRATAEAHGLQAFNVPSVQGGYFGLRGLSGRKWFIFLSSRMSMTSFFPLENWQEVKSGADEKLQRNRSKLDEVLRELEGETQQIMQRLASFEKGKRKLVEKIIEESG